MRALFVALAATLLFGCVESATGPTFSEQAQPNASEGFARIFVYRDKVLYLAQAPYIVRAQIAIDGQIVGSLANGGYLVTSVAAGHHSITAGSGPYQTTRSFDARGSGDGYIEIADKSRMEGARMAGEAAVGAVGATTRQDMYASAVSAALQDEAFSGNPERIWDVAFPGRNEAINKMQTLSLSQ
jgi:hypothetical protein